MSNDIGLGVVGIPNAGGMSKKPPHLIELTEAKKQNSNFVSLDRPELLGEFIQVKGAFISNTKVTELEKDVINFVNQIPKDEICDMLFPTHRVLSIKNLAFKAK